MNLPFHGWLFTIMDFFSRPPYESQFRRQNSRVQISREFANPMFNQGQQIQQQQQQKLQHQQQELPQQIHQVSTLLTN